MKKFATMVALFVATCSAPVVALTADNVGQCGERSKMLKVAEEEYGEKLLFRGEMFASDMTKSLKPFVEVYFNPKSGSWSALTSFKQLGGRMLTCVSAVGNDGNIGELMGGNPPEGVGENL